MTGARCTAGRGQACLTRKLMLPPAPMTGCPPTSSWVEPRPDLCFPQGQEVKAQPGLGNKQRDHQENALSSHPRRFSEIPIAQLASPVPHLPPPHFSPLRVTDAELSWCLMTQLSLWLGEASPCACVYVWRARKRIRTENKHLGECLLCAGH